MSCKPNAPQLTPQLDPYAEYQIAMTTVTLPFLLDADGNIAMCGGFTIDADGNLHQLPHPLNGRRPHR